MVLHNVVLNNTFVVLRDGLQSGFAANMYNIPAECTRLLLGDTFAANKVEIVAQYTRSLLEDSKGARKNLNIDY